MLSQSANKINSTLTTDSNENRTELSPEMKELFARADAGDARAQCNLGYYYEHGRGVNQDFAKAVALYERAAEQGNAYAQFNLGLCYQHGRGVNQDFAKAVALYERATEQGLADAQCNLGVCYENGQGVNQDFAKAVALYERAAERGHVSAQVRLEALKKQGHLHSSDVSTIASLASEAKQPELSTNSIPENKEPSKEFQAQLKLAQEGNTNDSNENKTELSPGMKKLFARADAGDAEAQYSLGLSYDQGVDNVNLNTAKAAILFEKAAEQGYARAQCKFALCNFHGRGVEQDFAKAIIWFKKAAEHENAGEEQGDVFRAQRYLGHCYKTGKGVEQDLAKAVEWYKRAAEQGDEFAQAHLGAFYEKGKGVKQDFIQAVAWYTKAAKQGDRGAQVRLEALKKQGHGSSTAISSSSSLGSEAKQPELSTNSAPENKEPSKEFQEQLKLAQEGNAQAQSYIGYCYYSNHEVTQDFVQAVAWFLKAADQGDAVAQFNLGVCYDNGQGVEQDVAQAVAWYQRAARQGNADALARLEVLKAQGNVLLAEHKTTNVQESPAIVSASRISVATFEALATVPANTLQAIALVSPDSFLTLAKARPLILQSLVDMGEDREKVEQEYKEIQNTPALQEFYDFFQRALTAVIAGSLSIESKMVTDARKSSAETVISWITKNIQIPFLQGTIQDVLEKLVGFGADRNRKQQVHRVAISFANLQNAGVIVEALARFIIQHEKNTILALAQPTQLTRSQEFVAKIKKLVRWIKADDLRTPERALAAEQAELVIENLMGKDASRALTLKDIPALAAIATKNKISASTPVSSTSYYSTGLITSSLFVAQSNTTVSTATGNVTNINAALFAQTTNVANAADSKATTATEQALIAQKKAIEAEQKAAQLEKELAEKNRRLEEMERREKDQAAKLLRLEERQNKSERELSHARAQLGKVDVLDELLTEVSDDGDQKQVNDSAVDRLDRGFARLQARDDEGRRAVIAKVSTLEETVSELQEKMELLTQQTKKNKKTANRFWQSNDASMKQGVALTTDQNKSTKTRTQTSTF